MVEIILAKIQREGGDGLRCMRNGERKEEEEISDFSDLFLPYSGLPG
jgi:hypothetical protein